MTALTLQSILVLLILNLVQVKSLNILAIFPYQGKSHFLVCEPLLKALAEKEHSVTVISYFPQQKSIQNYHDISLVGKDEIYENWVKVVEPSYSNLIMVTVFLLVTGTNNCKVLLADENVQKLWKNETKFDVILVEQFNSDCALGLAYKLGAPVVGFSSHTLMPYHYSRFGIPNNPSFTPFQLLNGGMKTTLLQRIERTLFTIYFQCVLRVIIQTIDQYTLLQYFKNVPYLEDLGREMKIMLVNDHFSYFGPSLLSTNVKQVGGLHIEDTKPLPPNIEKFINESEHGVIYISFGTTVNSASIPSEQLQIILGTVSKLRQRVIWKWDGDFLPGKNENIYISNWLPQNDILAHPNVLVMFYHCGLLGLTEALVHGMPVIGMPIFGDQPRNAAALEESGLGVQIQVNELNEEILLAKFHTVLNPKFRENVKLLSKMWHDRPINAKEEAIYWIEYAARYPNATLRAPSSDVPMYQYLCLDVIFILALFCTFILLIITYILKTCWMKYKEGKLNRIEKLKNV